MLPNFSYHRTRSLPEALGLLADLGEAVAPIAGGTELLLVMRFGLADYRHLVDISSIPELGTIVVRDGSVEIGAAVTHRELEISPAIRRSLLPYSLMTHRIANLRVRSVGTIGGNLCFADPNSDVGVFLAAAGAVVVAEDRAGSTLQWGVGDFLLGRYETSLQEGQLLRSIRMPALGPHETMIHHRFVTTERPTAAVTVRMSAADAKIASVTFAVGGVEERPVTVSLGELEGHDLVLGDETSRALAHEVAQHCSPTSDQLGSAAYKTHLVASLARRCLVDATATLSGDFS